MAEFQDFLSEQGTSPGTFVRSVDTSKAAERKFEQTIAGAAVSFGAGVAQGFQTQRLLGDASTFEEAIMRAPTGTEADKKAALGDITTLSGLARAREAGLNSRDAQIRANALVKNAMNSNPLFAENIKKAAREFLGVGLGGKSFLSASTAAEDRFKAIVDVGVDVFGESFKVWVQNDPNAATMAVQSHTNKVAEASQATLGNDLGVDFNALPANAQKGRAAQQLSLDMMNQFETVIADLGIDSGSWTDLAAQIENMNVAEKNSIQIQLQTLKNGYLAGKQGRFNAVNPDFYGAYTAQIDTLLAVADGSMLATTSGNQNTATQNAFMAAILDDPETASLWKLKQILPQGVSLDPGAQRAISELVSATVKTTLANKPVRDSSANDTDLHNTNLNSEDKTEYISVIKSLVDQYDDADVADLTPETNENYSQYVLDIFKGMGKDEAEASVLHQLFNVAASMDFDKFKGQNKAAALEMEVELEAGMKSYMAKVQRDLFNKLSEVDPSVRDAIGLSQDESGRIFVALDESKVSVTSRPGARGRFPRTEAAIREGRAFVNKVNSLYRLGDLVRAGSNVLDVDAQEIVNRVFPLEAREDVVLPTPSARGTGGRTGAVRREPEDINPEIEQIQEDESEKKNAAGEHIAHLDPLGNLTGGIGHLLTAEERTAFPEGTPISDEQVQAWFEIDIREAEADAEAFFESDRPEVMDILTNMAFNLGRTRLNRFKRLRSALAANDFETASFEMLNSKWADQVKGRAKRLASRMKRLGG